jgi:ABC-2 type transport system permease protein
VTALPADLAPDVRMRSGAREWVRSYATMTRWEFTGMRLVLPLIVLVQILLGAGFVLGISLFFEAIPTTVALYVCTGVPVINLVVLGMIMGPQLVANQKSDQGYEYLRTLPAPRTASMLAWYTVTLVGGLPAVVATLVIAQLRYDLPLTISPAIVPAIVLTSLTGTLIGYALAHAVEDPMAVRLVAQMLVFLILGFVPILFPVERLPGWLGALNWWLPFRHMAVIVRAGLTEGLVDDVAVSYAIVAAWAVACAVLAAQALGRRR